ncbi:hypothetical protein AWM68_17370 [Fictibacillus phosphorivorans]|uniref:XoxI protein n=1 Tax=Fictibacillus phosphorivorans TaxID=1221500 RepID=A0A165NWC2_9BACL|nr:hypothetical protein [Fictibacillus phosphorivorans]KZE67943.1 hypothetical protein AWM68_17370 [Fictibacillus phosphorivorans]
MKLKKPLFAIVMGISLLSFGTGASAAENDGLVDSSVAQSYKQLKPGTISIMAAPTNTSTTTVYNNFEGAYAVSKSTSTTTEDYIYAKCRTFNGSGEVLNTKTVSQYDSSYVAAKAVNGTFYIANDWAVGNHTYKLSGYNDVVHETRDDW